MTRREAEEMLGSLVLLAGVVVGLSVGVVAMLLVRGVLDVMAGAVS